MWQHMPGFAAVSCREAPNCQNIALPDATPSGSLPYQSNQMTSPGSCPTVLNRDRQSLEQNLVLFFMARSTSTLSTTPSWNSCRLRFVGTRTSATRLPYYKATAILRSVQIYVHVTVGLTDRELSRLTALQESDELWKDVLSEAGIKVLNHTARQWLGRDVIDVVDNFSVLKHGMYMPGNLPSLLTVCLGTMLK